MKHWSKILIIVALAGAVAGAVALRANERTAESNAASAAAPAESVAAETTSPSAAAEEPLLRLVDLGADKCIPCKMMAPILDELKEEYAGQFEVVFIDVWKEPAAGEAYDVQMIPTQVFYDAEGKEQFRHTGFFSKEDILAKWEELGVL